MYCPHCDRPLSVMRNASCPHCLGALRWTGSVPHVYHRPPPSNIAFWIRAWCGTVAAGGLFGLVIGLVAGPMGCLVGLVFGCLIAAMYGIPIVITIAVLSWVFWLSRFRIAAARLAGFLTGFAALLGPVASFRFDDLVFLMFAAIPGVVGMAGSGLASARYWRRGSADNEEQISSPARWQFSLSQLYQRMAVVSVLFAAWLALFRVLEK